MSPNHEEKNRPGPVAGAEAVMLTEELPQAMGRAVERIFSQLEPLTLLGMKRLMNEHLDQTRPDEAMGTYREGGPDPVLFQTTIMQSFFGELCRKLEREHFRDEDDRFKAQIIFCLSLCIEDRMVNALALEKPLALLARANPEAHACLRLKFHLGYTYGEIAAERGSSVQRVRTHLQKAYTFLKSQF